MLHERVLGIAWLHVVGECDCWSELWYLSFPSKGFGCTSAFAIRHDLRHFIH